MGLNEAQKKERSEYLEQNLEITECSQRKPYVFISYASDNWETVFKDAVVPLQRRYGLRTYADKAFDKVNDKWIVPMLRNVRGADAIVAFVSQSYIESYACFLELLTAVNNRKQIVFVSLEENLRLGDTTDQPIVERGVKSEILNQGGNIATNTNNTSNDIMRAMKSAYTSLSTLLEQDALSKYDISDAFINFFRDASINKKTIHDILAVKDTIRSISRKVFDPDLVSEPVPAPRPEPTPPPAPEPEPEPAATVMEPWDYGDGETEMVDPDAEPEFLMGQGPVPNPGVRSEPWTPPGAAAGEKPGGGKKWWKNLAARNQSGLALGVLSILFLFASQFLLSTISILIGIALSVKGLKSDNKKPAIIGLVLTGAVILFYIFCYWAYNSSAT